MFLWLLPASAITCGFQSSLSSFKMRQGPILDEPYNVLSAGLGFCIHHPILYSIKQGGIIVHICWEENEAQSGICLAQHQFCQDSSGTLNIQTLAGLFAYLELSISHPNVNQSWSCSAYEIRQQPRTFRQFGHNHPRHSVMPQRLLLLRKDGMVLKSKTLTIQLHFLPNGGMLSKSTAEARPMSTAAFFRPEMKLLDSIHKWP